MRRFVKFIVILILVLPFNLKGEPRVIPEAHRQDANYHLATDFLEHYIQLLQTPKNQVVFDSIKRIRDDGFTYLFGNDNKILNLKGTEDFSIFLKDNRYVAQWSLNDTPIVSCIFPANIFLLTSSNKIDLENAMIERLQNSALQSDSIQRPKTPKSELNPISLSNFYISDKGFYITPRLKNQLIYEIDSLDSDICQLLIDTNRYQIESFANMMLTGYSSHPQLLSIMVDKYGYKKQKVEIPLANFVTLLEDEGCSPYWGVDTFDGKNIKGVYLWVNPYGGYAHMLTVDGTIDAISKSSIHSAKLHCYLRLDNLKNLFEEYN